MRYCKNDERILWWTGHPWTCHCHSKLYWPRISNTTVPSTCMRTGGNPYLQLHLHAAEMFYTWCFRPVVLIPQGIPQATSSSSSNKHIPNELIVHSVKQHITVLHPKQTIRLHQQCSRKCLRSMWIPDCFLVSLCDWSKQCSCDRLKAPTLILQTHHEHDSFNLEGKYDRQMYILHP